MDTTNLFGLLEVTPVDLEPKFPFEISLPRIKDPVWEGDFHGTYQVLLLYTTLYYTVLFYLNSSTLVAGYDRASGGLEAKHPKTVDWMLRPIGLTLLVD